MIYFDTSYLVRLYFDEPGAESVRAQGHAETVAAFHRKLRDGAIRPAAYAAPLSRLGEHDSAGAFHWLFQGSEIFARIARVHASLPSTVFLRAADALHLATAAESGFGYIYSNDTHLLAAARYFNLEGRNIIDGGG